MKIENITDETILELWKIGSTVKQISKKYAREQKKKGNKITEVKAQDYVEPLIFSYQTSLMKRKELRVTTEELLRYMLAFFQNVDKDLSAEKEKLKQKEAELCDLDHYIEIHKLKSYEHAKVGKMRKTVREERRQIKYNIEVMEAIKRFSDKYNNKLIQGDIINCLKEQTEIKQRQEHPTYKYRTDIIEKLEAKDEV